MALREADRAGGLAHEVVLLDQPPILQVPPLGAVEDVIEAGAGGFLGLIGGAAERLGDETGVGMPGLDVMDEPVPEIARDLVSGVAAEALEPERQQMLHHAEAIAIEPFRVARVLVIELGQVLPDDFLAVVLAEGVRDPAIGLAEEPFRVLTGQPRVNGGVVDDEVNHHLQAAGAGGCASSAGPALPAARRSADPAGQD